MASYSESIDQKSNAYSGRRIESNLMDCRISWRYLEPHRAITIGRYIFSTAVLSSKVNNDRDDMHLTSMLNIRVKFHENRTSSFREIITRVTSEWNNEPTNQRIHVTTISPGGGNRHNNYATGSPRLAQISLPWQQGSAPQHFAWFHWIGHPRKPPGRPKHVRCICHTSRLIGDLCKKIAQMSLPWQQRSAPQHFAWFRWIGNSPKPPVWCKNVACSSTGYKVMAATMQRYHKQCWGVNFGLA